MCVCVCVYNKNALCVTNTLFVLFANLTRYLKKQKFYNIPLLL